MEWGVLYLRIKWKKRLTGTQRLQILNVLLLGCKWALLEHSNGKSWCTKGVLQIDTDPTRCEVIAHLQQGSHYLHNAIHRTSKGGNVENKRNKDNQICSLFFSQAAFHSHLLPIIHDLFFPLHHYACLQLKLVPGVWSQDLAFGGRRRMAQSQDYEQIVLSEKKSKSINLAVATWSYVHKAALHTWFKVSLVY